MPASNFAPSWICAVLSVIALAISLRQRRKQRLLADLPTSKTEGIFVGLVEVCGTAEAEVPLTSYLAEKACVHFAYEVQEEWSRTVTETYTDKDGKTQTRTRQESGWETVQRGGETEDFYLRDDCGAVLVRPEGAKLEAQTLVDVTATPNDAIYYGKGPAGAVPDSRFLRRFVERTIELHAPLYVVGQAREREDIVAPEIAASREAPMFLISTRSEKTVQRGEAAWSWFWWALALALAIAAPAIAGHILMSAGRFDQRQVAALIAASASVFLLLWAGGWIWMVFNSLVSLRQRVRQAWSLIDVQLKRRHDLIPSLVSVVAGLSSHEQSTQAAVAALRTQQEATAPGVAGPDFDGVVGQLRAVTEKYPQLVAQPAFAQLHRSLVETEQRIALARTYYNDIATHFATRLERIPERWVGALAGMRPEALLNAENFERAAVNVQFADAR